MQHNQNRNNCSHRIRQFIPWNIPDNLTFILQSFFTSNFFPLNKHENLLLFDTYLLLSYLTEMCACMYKQHHDELISIVFNLHSRHAPVINLFWTPQKITKNSFSGENVRNFIIVSIVGCEKFSDKNFNYPIIIEKWRGLKMRLEKTLFGNLKKHLRQQFSIEKWNYFK